MSAEPRILLTGFSPFPGAPLNPSRVIMKMHRQANANHNIRSVTFPTSYRIVSKHIDQVLKLANPDIVISFGLAYAAKGVRLETKSYNTTAPDALDIEGKVGPDFIFPNGPDCMETSFPVSQLMTVLIQEGFAVEISSNPGRYLCNYLYYRVNHFMRTRNKNGSCLFIHIPPAREQIPELHANGITPSETWCLPLQDLFRMKGVVEDVARREMLKKMR